MPRTLRVLFDDALALNPAGTGTFVRGLQPVLSRCEGLTVIPAGAADRPHQLDIGNKRTFRRLRNAVERIAYYLTVLPRRAKVAQCDVIYCPAAVTPLSGAIPAVMTVFDMTSRRYPQTLDPMSRIFAQQMLRIGLGRCAAFCTISAAVRSELLAYDRRLTASRVVVAYPGPNPELIHATPQAALPPDERYLLMVGTLEPRKNHVTVLRAFAEHRRRQPQSSLRLVLAGSPGWRYQPVLEEINRLGVESAVLRLGPTQPSQLMWLYQHARALLFPSVYEGFGLPVLEAFILGCPVVASRIPSVLEIGSSDSTTFLEPSDVASWAEAIASIDRGAAPSAQVAAANERARHFTWEACAASVRDALRLAAG